MDIICWLWIVPAAALLGFFLYPAVTGTMGGSETPIAVKDSSLSALPGMTGRMQDVLFNRGFAKLDDIANSNPARIRCILRRYGIDFDPKQVDAWPRTAHEASIAPQPAQGRSDRRRDIRYWVIIAMLALASVALFAFKRPLGCGNIHTATCADCPSRPGPPDKPSPASCPVVPPIVTCPETKPCSVETVLIPQDALFEFNKAELRPEGKELFLSQLRTQTQHSDLTKLNITQIIGHTDPFGEVDYNLDLSDRRAKEIKRILQDAHVTSVDSIKAEGLGEQKPLTEVLEICQRYYPKLVNLKNRAQRKPLEDCYQPLRRVELTIGPQ